MKTNDREYKADSASSVTKEDISPDFVPTNTPELQKLVLPMPQLSPSKPTGL